MEISLLFSSFIAYKYAIIYIAESCCSQGMKVRAVKHKSKQNEQAESCVIFNLFISLSETCLSIIS